jgi:hypothetical protein
VTIRKGESWGEPAPVPEGLEVLADDAALFRALNRPEPARCIGLLTGDLARTVGAPGDRGRFVPGVQAVRLTMDVGRVELDGRTHRFAAHAVVRRSWWRGRIVAVCNAQFMGVWDVAPRSHPNDGYLDTLEVHHDMGVRQRWAARGRLPTGSHVPHPLIATRRQRAGEWTFSRPHRVWVDGVGVGTTRRITVAIEPDALTVYI